MRHRFSPSRRICTATFFRASDRLFAFLAFAQRVVARSTKPLTLA